MPPGRGRSSGCPSRSFQRIPCPLVSQRCCPPFSGTNSARAIISWRTESGAVKTCSIPSRPADADWHRGNAQPAGNPSYTARPTRRGTAASAQVPSNANGKRKRKTHVFRFRFAHFSTTFSWPSTSRHSASSASWMPRYPCRTFRLSAITSFTGSFPGNMRKTRFRCRSSGDSAEGNFR